MSQRQIAEEIGIDAPKLTKSLKGERRFSSYELAALAELDGRTVDWLLTGVEPKRLAFAYRSTLLDHEVDDNAGRETASLIADRFQVAFDLGFAPVVPPLPTARVSGGYVETADRFAHAAVERIARPIRELDSAALIRVLEEQFGVNVAVEELPERVDGLSHADGDLRIVVAASTDRSGRQRFTLAHELGHLLLGDANGAVIEEELFTKGVGHQEPRANAFAASFLMPAAEVVEVLGTREVTEAFDELVWEFRVSPDAMAWRLCNLGKLTKGAAMRLARKTLNAVAADLGRLDEHAARIRESSTLRPAGRLAGAYIGAFLAGEVAAAPVAEISGFSIDAVYALRDELELPEEWPNLFEQG
jgi:Zn-dependent peptidase ImmA (M78 family)